MWPGKCHYTPCLICHISHRSWQHFKTKFLWKHDREQCYALALIQTWYSHNDRENRVDFYKSFFPGAVKMCFGFMSFRAPSTAPKQENYHNSPNMKPIITQFQMRFKFMKRHLSTRHRFKIIKRVLSLQAWFIFGSFIYIRQKLCKKTCICVPFKCEERVLEFSRVWPWRWPRGGTPCMIFIGPVFHYTIKTCLKRVTKRTVPR